MWIKPGSYEWVLNNQALALLRLRGGITSPPIIWYSTVVKVPESSKSKIHTLRLYNKGNGKLQRVLNPVENKDQMSRGETDNGSQSERKLLQSLGDLLQSLGDCQIIPQLECSTRGKLATTSVSPWCAVDSARATGECVAQLSLKLKIHDSGPYSGCTPHGRGP